MSFHQMSAFQLAASCVASLFSQSSCVSSAHRGLVSELLPHASLVIIDDLDLFAKINSFEAIDGGLRGFLRERGSRGAM